MYWVTMFILLKFNHYFFCNYFFKFQKDAMSLMYLFEI